ncbi:MAG: hypothetical protein IPI07_09065 [Flavobacteriales bacterium]|nr:hypothetical protein [Flavobacteriales bacterium]
MPTEVLRVGILCNGGTFQRWQAESIAAVRAEPGVELVLLIERDAETASPKSIWTRALHYPWRTVLYRQYRKHWFRPKAMEPVDLSSELSNVPKIRCRPILRGHAELFEEADLALIRSHRPDVLLRFGFNILHGDILTVATHGVWSHHHGDEEHYRGGPPAFWEIVDAQPVIGAVLQRLTEKLDAGRILYKGWFNTVDHSLEETVDTVLTHSAQWPALVMRRILQGDAVAAEGTLSTSKAPVRKYPTNTVVLRFLWKRMRNKMRFHRDSLNAHEEWNIGVLNQPIHHLLQTEPSLNVRWLPAPAQNSFRADPFGFVGSDGQLHILYEKFDHATGKGEIARLRPKRDNVLKRSRTVLELPEHLSYPFVLERDGEVLVIPEQAARGRVGSLSPRRRYDRVGTDSYAFGRTALRSYRARMGRSLVDVRYEGPAHQCGALHLPRTSTGRPVDTAHLEPGESGYTVRAPWRHALRPQRCAIPPRTGQFAHLWGTHRAEPGDRAGSGKVRGRDRAAHRPHRWNGLQQRPAHDRGSG